MRDEIPDFAIATAADFADLTLEGVISGRGKNHTNKYGTNPYTRLEWADIVAMVDSPQPGVEKDQAQWLIPSTLDSRVHAEQAKRGSFHMLWADADWKDIEKPLPMPAVAETVAKVLKGADYEVYASRSATEDRQKCRVLVPLDEPLCGADWILAQRALNAVLDEAGIPPDISTTGAGQPCYLPNRGQWYQSLHRREGKRFNPLASWWDRLAAIRQQDQAKADVLNAEREAKRKQREALIASNVGNDAPSLIKAFNATHAVADILLQAGYDEQGDTFRHPESESGSFSASVKDGRVHSLSSSDPLFTGGGGGGAHDAFSAFTVLFHGGDQRKALIDAGNTWVMVEGESWNRVRRRKFMEERNQASVDDFECLVTRYRPRRYLELISLPTATELIEDLLPAEGSFCIFGQSGAGKTFLALHMMLALAKGEEEWFGHSLKQTPILFIALEGQQGIRDRLAAYLCQFGGDIPDAFRVIYEPLNLTDPDHRPALIHAIQNCGLQAPVVLIDTMTRATPGLDLNGPKDMGLVVSALDEIQREIGGLVGTIYHSTIKSNGSSEEQTEMGHSSYRGSLDASILVYEKDGMKFWKSAKVKDGPSGGCYPFSLAVHEVRKNQWGNPKRSCAVKPLTGAEADSARERQSNDRDHAARLKLVNHLWLRGEVDGWKKDWHGVPNSECLRVIGGKKQDAVEILSSLVDMNAVRLVVDGGGKTSPKFYRMNADWVAPEEFQPFPPPPADLCGSEVDLNDL
jgi:hypothetical protein